MARTVNIPWIPDYDNIIADLVTRIAALETEVASARSAVVKRYYVESMPADVTDIDLSAQGITYVPGTNSILFFGNFVKQIVGESFIELDPTTIRLTDPTVGGETIEIYVLPIPLSAA